MIVLDSSAVVTAFTADDDRATGIRVLLADEVAVAPELIDLEFCNALRGSAARQEISLARATHALSLFRSMAIRRVSPSIFLERCWELRETVTPYDASYVALSEQMGIPLVTSDARLSRAPGPRCAFRLV